MIQNIYINATIIREINECMTITAVVLTKNNQNNIESLIDSLSWCNEVLIIDDKSSDATVAKAQSKHANVIIHPLNSDFAAQRNIAFSKGTGDWYLFIDSDEVISQELVAEIKDVISRDDKDGYYVKRQDIFHGKVLEFGETASVRLLRLAKKGMGEWKGSVHETWEIKGRTGELQHPLLHSPHPTIGEFISDINYYSTLVAQEKNKKNEKSSAFAIIAYPLAKFIQNYIVRQGYRDGTHGTIFAFLMSFHSFLVRSKLYLLSAHTHET